VRPDRCVPALLAGGLLAAGAPLLAATPAGAAGHPVTVTIWAEEPEAHNAWSRDFAALPRQRLKLLIEYRNTSADVERNVVVRLGLAHGLTPVGPRSMLTNALHPHGFPASTNLLVHRGIRIGDYAPGANGLVQLTVALPAAGRFRCGWNDLRSMVAVGVPGIGTATNALHVRVQRECPTAGTTVAPPA
jgi:hypothetical protein